MPELFPELKGLKGGKKQAWINERLEVIAALNNELGFEETARILHMKADTLVRALRITERRPAVTEANKAMGRAVLNEKKIDAVITRLNHHAEALETHFAEDRQLLESQVQFYKLQAAANTMMAELMSIVAHTRDLTYHIISPPRRKVGPTQRAGCGRLFLCPGTGRDQLPVPVNKGKALHRKGTHRRPRDG